MWHKPEQRPQNDCMTEKLLHRLCNPNQLRRMTRQSTFERGTDYVQNGRVMAMEYANGVLTAEVRGTQCYQIKLWIRSGALQASCTCLSAAEGAFCKHCVAVGLLFGRNDF